MTSREMHIGVELGVQRINSFANKSFLPEELDWLLNKEVIKFIKQRTNPDSNLKNKGFQDDSKRVADLKDLLRTTTRNIFTDNTGGKYITFPPDYFHYVRFDSSVKKKCEPSNLLLVNKTIKKFVLPINVRNLETTLTTFTIAIDGTPVFSLSDLPANYLTNTNFGSQYFMLIKALKILLPKKLKELYTSSPELYWEIIGYDYEANSFILLIDEDITNISITINTNTVNYTSTNHVLSSYNNDFPLKGHIKVIDEEFKGLAVNSNLSKSRPNSLISSIKQNCLELSIPDSVVVNNVSVTYFCKPSLIDLSLNSDLNMSDSVCEEIIDNTVRFIKALIEDKNYEAYIRENMLIE